MRGTKSILLVEDDKIDAMTVKRAFKDLRITNQLEITRNGEEALEYLYNNNKPCIILLDLNMPKMNGIEFLEIAKKDQNLKNIPVVMLTTSKDEQDKLHGYGLGIAGYMVKPVEYQKFLELVKTINMYWTLSELPSNHH